MYLVHNSPYLCDILTSGKLLSSYDTGNINEGGGVYTSSKHVFFYTVKDIAEIKEDAIILDSKFLYNRKWFTYPLHNIHPELWKAYPRYSKNIDSTLEQLYTQSKKRHEYFTVFQQISINPAVLSNVVGIKTNDIAVKKLYNSIFPSTLM